MEYTNKDIISKLESYKDLKRKALQLAFELENYQAEITDDDIIETMMFNNRVDEYVSSGQFFDKTANIAVSYSEKAVNMNIRRRQDLENEYSHISLELRRLEYYISIIEQKYSDILRLLYLEDMTYVSTAAELNISLATVPNNRNKAIEKLTEMYNRIVTN